MRTQLIILTCPQCEEEMISRDFSHAAMEYLFHCVTTHWDKIQELHDRLS